MSPFKTEGQAISQSKIIVHIGFQYRLTIKIKHQQGTIKQSILIIYEDLKRWMKFDIISQPNT